MCLLWFWNSCYDPKRYHVKYFQQGKAIY